MGVGNVKMLLGRSDLNPNTPDEYGRTPLSWAAGNGHGMGESWEYYWNATMSIPL